MLYRILKRLIENKQTDKIEEKLDVFYAAGKLSKEEYNNLIAALYAQGIL